ncbi:MAG: hypothetical protein J6S87_03560, partial [Bacteroidales bacterium]|nr:hypothetical protein [Bacteroidales bacterium]
NMGDYSSEYVMLPRQLVGYEPIIMITVRGESMCGAGIETGDVVTLRLGDCAEDGDIVMAWLDGEVTLKVFYRDEDGEAWLVPQNTMYQPIRMSEFTSVWILGVVVDVKKSVGRVPFRQIQQQMRSLKHKEEPQVLTDAVVKKAVQKILPKMTTSRQWFCVYRVLADKGFLHERAFYELNDCMNRLFPNNDFSINVKDLSRMAVGCFDKRLFFWEEQAAPVQGKRFLEYLALAQEFQRLLE